MAATTVYFLFFLKRLKTNAPIKAPYKVLFTGLEVMAQVPDAQPTCCQ